MLNLAVHKMPLLLQRLVWLLAGEGVARVTRLLTAVVLSRTLGPYEFGVAAIVLASDELVRVASRNGIGIKVIQAEQEQLDRTCQGVYRINWVISIALAVLQVLIAKPLALYFSYPPLQAMLTVLALVYCIYPLAMVHVYRVQRRQDMKLTASIYGAQVGADNILTAVLALAGCGVWSVIIPKVLVAPLWVYCYRKAEQWRFEPKAVFMPFAEVWQFSRDVLLVEVLKVVRGSIDRLFIGAVLGVEAVGIYFFAVNAGSGLSLALIGAFNTLIMPHLCQQKLHEQRQQQSKIKAVQDGKSMLRKRYKQSLGKFVLFIVPIILLQLALAPWYVPVVFGQHWQFAVPVLMVLCMAVIFHGLIEVGTQVLRAHNKTRFDLMLSTVFAVVYMGALGIGCQFDIQAVAIATLLVQITFFIVAYLLINHSGFIDSELDIEPGLITKNNKITGATS